MKVLSEYDQTITVTLYADFDTINAVECYTDSDYIYSVPLFNTKHNSFSFILPQTEFSNFCSGIVNVKITYTKDDEQFEKVVETMYYIDNTDIDHLVHLPLPTLLKDSFVYDFDRAVDVLKFVANLDTARVDWSGDVQALGVGSYQITATPHYGFDFGRGVNSITLSYEVTKRTITIPTPQTIDYSGYAQNYPSGDGYIITTPSQIAVGTYDVTFQISDNCIWSDGTTEDKTLENGLTIQEIYYNKEQIDAKIGELQTKDSTILTQINDNKNEQATKNDELQAQIDTNSSLINANKTAQTDKNAEFSNAISSLEDKISSNQSTQSRKNQELDDKNSTQDTAISDLQSTVSANKSAQDTVNSKQSNQNDTFASQIKTLQGFRENQMSKNDSQDSKISTLQTTVANNKSATETAISELQSSIDSNKELQDAKNTELDSADTLLNTKLSNLDGQLVQIKTSNDQKNITQDTRLDSLEAFKTEQETTNSNFVEQFKNYLTTSDFNTTIADYLKSSDAESTYAKLNDLKSYIQSSDMSGGFVQGSALLSQILSEYYTTEDDDTNHFRYYNINGLPTVYRIPRYDDFITIMQTIGKKEANKALTVLDDYAKVSDLSGFLTSADLPTDHITSSTVKKVVEISEEDYKALTEYESNTLYIVK